MKRCKCEAIINIQTYIVILVNIIIIEDHMVSYGKVLVPCTITILGSANQFGPIASSRFLAIYPILSKGQNTFLFQPTKSTCLIRPFSAL